jgi:uncharacterized phage protein (TIGR02216 family)
MCCKERAVKKSDQLPWTGMMEIAFGVLRLSPESFWKMTPCEWQAGVRGWKQSRGIDPDPVIERGDLCALMQQFPDVTPQ